MRNTHFYVAVIGAGAAGTACAQHLQSQGCGVVVFDPAQGATIADIWHDEGWRLASREQGAHGQRFDALVLALPARQSAELLEPLLPMTAMRAFTMMPSREHCMWIPAVRVGLCGEWLCGGPDVDAALSGRALAARLLSEFAAV
jgi:predicted NAD/FAD-dependent oxidoreductase